ncbi:MAG: D-alanyl-D-alanine endopeptidase [Burkholderiales bacterium]
MLKGLAIFVSAVAGFVMAHPGWAASSSEVMPRLESNAAIVVDQEQGTALFAKNVDTVTPIASITKLMTAVVVLEAKLPLDEVLEVSYEDMDFVKGTRSRLGIGTRLTRAEMLKLALMASENRAASALGRNYPGGFPAFVAAMNRKARELGMSSTRFVDSTGLHPENVSTAEDLVRLVDAGYRHPLIREFTTSESHYVALDNSARSRVLAFNNSNGLVRSGEWDIGLSKTGYISEAGRCLVMQAQIGAKPYIIVLLDSWGKLSRIADANRVKSWVEGKLGLRDYSPTPRFRQASVRVSKTIRSRHESRRFRVRRV